MLDDIHADEDVYIYEINDYRTELELITYEPGAKVLIISAFLIIDWNMMSPIRTHHASAHGD